MAQYLNQIAAPVTQEKATDADFVARGRGDGQAAAMRGTNARGYAWFHHIDGWDTTRWEWLHLRGAGLGGATLGSNLVLGTRDANTQMMPFESNMRALQTVAGASANYTGVRARWLPDGQVQRHAYNNIEMQWVVPRTELGVTANVPQISGRVDIHPLSVGEVLSKAEVRHIEQALKAVRLAAEAVPEPMDIG